MWRCYQPYGCFYIGAPWSGENRPVSTFPARPDSINPRYILYTRSNRENPHELIVDQNDTYKSAPFIKNANVQFIIHGFLDNGDKTWVLVGFYQQAIILCKVFLTITKLWVYNYAIQMCWMLYWLFQRTMKELLIRENSNVIVVNWIGGAGPPYTQAVANTRLVGAITARLAAQLIEFKHASPVKMHCIGHSLGAHVSGYVGYNLRVQYGYTLGRITGIKHEITHLHSHKCYFYITAQFSLGRKTSNN